MTQATEAAEKIADHLQSSRYIAVEMFVLEDDTIVINELAPRPHNSGHYSIEACTISQFHQHVRAICGWPLRKPVLAPTDSHGECIRRTCSSFIERNFQIPRLVHSFIRKEEAKTKRKMGHVTIFDKRY